MLESAGGRRGIDDVLHHVWLNAQAEGGGHRGKTNLLSAGSCKVERRELQSSFERFATSGNGLVQSSFERFATSVKGSLQSSFERFAPLERFAT